MESIQIIKEKIIPILQQYGITKAAIFGSLAKGEATTISDVDILVETCKGLKHDRPRRPSTSSPRSLTTIVCSHIISHK